MFFITIFFGGGLGLLQILMRFAEELFKVGPCFLMGFIFTPKFALVEENVGTKKDDVSDLHELVWGVGYIPCICKHHAVLNLLDKGFEEERKVKG